MDFQYIFLFVLLAIATLIYKVGKNTLRNYFSTGVSVLLHTVYIIFITPVI